VFAAKFVNKMSRVIVACSDGGARSGIAAKLVSEAGFSSIVTIEGGIDAYLAVSPLTDKDKKTRISRVTQTDAGASHIHIMLYACGWLLMAMRVCPCVCVSLL
jgi:formylmethanofuran:tetrahydromethanopterin formyltransferase